MALHAASLSRPASAFHTTSFHSRQALQGLCACTLVLGLWAGDASASKPHQHGVANVDIAVDPGRISLRLDIPLDNLLGFERAPRTDAERAQAQTVVKQLSDAATVVRLDSAAGCSVARVALVSAELGLPADGQGQKDAHAHGDHKHDHTHDHKHGDKHGHKHGDKDSGHADLVADYEFSCTDTGKARSVTLGLFEAFPRLRRIEVQTATPRGQLKAVLARPNNRVSLAR